MDVAAKTRGPVENSQVGRVRWFTRRFSFSSVAISFVATILVCAGALKVHQLAVTPLLHTGLFSSRWLVAALVQFEWLLAAWLLSGFYRQAAYRLAMTTFFVFAVFSLTSAVRGESCRCFGVVEVSSWFSFILDGLCVAMLVWSHRVWTTGRPDGSIRVAADSVGASRLVSNTSYRSTRVIGLAGLLMISGGVLSWIVMNTSETLVDADGLLVGAGRMVVLSPDEWKGEPFPLLTYIAGGERLREGAWEVWIHRDNCPACHQLLKTLPGRESKTPLALVRLPPYEKEANLDVGAALWLQMNSEQYKWIVETPVKLRIQDGVVVR